MVPAAAPPVAALGAVVPGEVVSAAIASDEAPSSNAVATAVIVRLRICVSVGVWCARLSVHDSDHS